MLDFWIVVFWLRGFLDWFIFEFFIVVVRRENVVCRARGL